MTGSRSIKDARLAARKFGAIVRMVGSKDAKTSEIKIQNVVCTWDCRFAIRLEALALAHGKFSSFEVSHVKQERAGERRCVLRWWGPTDLCESPSYFQVSFTASRTRKWSCSSS